MRTMKIIYYFSCSNIILSVRPRKPKSRDRLFFFFAHFPRRLDTSYTYMVPSAKNSSCFFSISFTLRDSFYCTLLPQSSADRLDCIIIIIIALK